MKTSVFPIHLRWMLGASVLALIVIAVGAPSSVHSVAPMFVNPPVLTVTATSNNGISLSWPAQFSATDYGIERSETMSGPFKNIDLVTTNTYTDLGVTSQKAYVYRVRAINFNNGEFSDPSNMAVGTAISFEFSALLGQTIKARHLHDVRTAVNAVRRVALLPDVTFLPQNLTGLTVNASHVQDLRNSLGQALTTLGIPNPPYTDPTLNTGAGGTLIKAVHIEELQARSTRGSSSSAGPLYSSSSKAIGGEFAPMDFLQLVAVHLSVLPDRRVLYWGRDMLLNNAGEVKQRGGSSDAYVWDMVSNQHLFVPNSTTNLFCSGHSFLPDGNLFVSGGHRSAHFDGAGEASTNIFNYNTNTWTAGPVMNHGRWYPYNVTLNTGEPVIMAGSYWSNEPAPPYNPYDPNTAVPAHNITTNITPQSYTPGVAGGLKDLAEPSSISTYPFLHLLTSGKVFQAQTGFGTGNNPDHVSRLYDPVANAWSSLPSTLKHHAMGTSAMYVDDTVMLIGGFGTSFAPVPDVESINLAAGSPAWTLRESMRFPRVYHTATLLPDGKVLVSGGVACPGSINIQTVDPNTGMMTCSDGAVLSPELWDPQTGKWTTMNKHNDVRAYHSIAALLPDGRVLVGGGGLPGAVGERGLFGAMITNVNQDWARLFGHSSIEIFSPPYLFDANGNPAVRPVITSAPASATYGETITVSTTGAGLTPKVSLVRLPSVTHGTNQDQRLISIDPVVVPGGIQVTIPTSPSKVPPGHYMLFVLNNGVPSVSAIIRVQNQNLFPTAAPQTFEATAQAFEQGTRFSSSVNGQITHIRFWKAPGETGTHVGRIWADNGLALASVFFTNETASGWQEAQLQTPLSITANVKYRVSFNVQTVSAKTLNGLASPITSGPLVAWGSYTSPFAGFFPNTATPNNGFVDVKFR